MQHYQALVSDAIARLDWSRDPEGLYQPIAYALSVGGKHLRPAMTLMAADIYGAKLENIMPAALALEMFHNFTLLHDDLMDHAAMRRGQATVQKKYGANTAILSGDQMLISAYQLLESAKISDADFRRVTKMFSKMAEQICQGQQYDMDFEKRDDVTAAEYIHMIELKTSVLLASALSIGATLAGAPVEHVKCLYKFGINLGLAFQLRDDYLDVYGTQALGKTIGGDILNNKKTYLLISAIDLAKAEMKNSLEYWMQPSHDSEPEAKIAAIKEIYDKLGVPQVTLKAIEKYTKQAQKSLDKLDIEPEKKDILLKLADALLKRNK